MEQDYKQFLIPVRVVGETKQTLTIQVPKNDDYKFKLSKDTDRNQFLTVAFVKNKEGNLELWKPWEHKLNREKK